jgi:hypothetical protein
MIEKAEKLPLSQSLPSALRLALAANDSELATWIRLELLGYTRDNPAMTQQIVVPEYRTVRGQWFDSYGRLFLVQDPKLDFMNETRLRAAVGELESFVGADGVLSQSMSDVAQLIQDHLHVDVNEFRFTPHSVEQVLANIRAQLLDRIAGHRAQLDTPAVAVQRTAHDEEVILLRPSIYGVGINLRALWRRWRSKPKGRAQ